MISMWICTSRATVCENDIAPLLGTFPTHDLMVYALSWSTYQFCDAIYLFARVAMALQMQVQLGTAQIDLHRCPVTNLATLKTSQEPAYGCCYAFCHSAGCLL